jgi:hypothetical protein
MILEFIERLVRKASGKGLDFLIIGGHAVAHHGYARMTLDVDFLVPESQRAGWNGLLREFRYEAYTDQAAFMQFASGASGWPNIDLMIVHDDTWAKLRAEAVEKSHRGLSVYVPAVRHLIALKLHAAKSATRSTPEKDWNDIVELVRRHRLDPNEDEFSALILRYGGEESLSRIRAVWQTLQSENEP